MIAHAPTCRAAALLGLLALLAPLSPARLAAQSLPGTEDCVACHLELADSALARPARVYPDDVHAQAGFGCLVCHGGPRTARGTLRPESGFLSIPSRAEIPVLCGRCHSDAAFMRDFDPSIRVDQVTEYYSSVHGQLLRGEGDTEMATCVSCHPAHDIRPPSDPSSTVHPLNVGELCASCHSDPTVMEPRGVPTDQLEAYRGSVHGDLLYEEGDVSAPTCNDCHGNHGAAPPGIASVHNVCGQCHTVMDDYFGESGHGPWFEEEGLPGCVTCHDNHAIQPPEHLDLIARSETVCEQCHEAGDPAGREFRVMASLVDSLLEARARARHLLDSAENVGMHVSEALFQLQEVDNSLTQARSAVHTFSSEAVAEQVDEGMEIVAATAERGQEALEEHTFRRVGLATSSALIFVLILSLLARIRALDRRLEPTLPTRRGPAHD